MRSGRDDARSSDRNWRDREPERNDGTFALRDAGT